MGKRHNFDVNLYARANKPTLQYLPYSDVFIYKYSKRCLYVVLRSTTLAVVPIRGYQYIYKVYYHKKIYEQETLQT